MHYSAEKVGSFENLVAFGERERNKVSLDDFTVRDIAAERREQEQKIAPRRSVEWPQPRRTVTISPDYAAAVERQRERERAQQQAVELEQQRKKEQKRTRGRGM
jgi:hypothetical protein